MSDEPVQAMLVLSEEELSFIWLSIDAAEQEFGPPDTDAEKAIKKSIDDKIEAARDFLREANERLR
jgi:hypothetical protein